MEVEETWLPRTRFLVTTMSSSFSLFDIARRTYYTADSRTQHRRLTIHQLTSENSFKKFTNLTEF